MQKVTRSQEQKNCQCENYHRNPTATVSYPAQNWQK